MTPDNQTMEEIMLEFATATEEYAAILAMVAAGYIRLDNASKRMLEAMAEQERQQLFADRLAKLKLLVNEA